MTLYAGLDAGASGGVALFSNTGELKTISLKRSESEVAAFLRDHAGEIKFAVCEQQWIRLGDHPRIGVLIESYGTLKGMLVMAGIKYSVCPPARWQYKILGMTSGGDKPFLAKVAKAWFPDEKITLQTCDAVLIAVYAASLHGFEIPEFPKHLIAPDPEAISALREF